MASPLNVGRRDVVEIADSSETHLVSTGDMHLHGLEDGTIRCWADHHVVTLHEETGLVVVHGDLGTYVHSWPPSHRPNRTLHEFLARITFDQFMTKASTIPHMEFDRTATLDQMRRELLADRRSGRLNRIEARKLWDLIQEDLEDVGDEREFIEAIWRDRDLSARYYDGDPPYVAQRVRIIARRFWDEVWETFRQQVLIPRVDMGREIRAA